MEVKFLEKPYQTEQVEKLLHPLVKEWFFSKYRSFSEPQLYGVKEIHERNNILISAPTGGTKTLTAFLSIINELVGLSLKNKLEDKVYAIYISPLKALNNDIAINLEEPLKEIKELAKLKGLDINIRIGVRTGDTTPNEKQKMLKKVPHILITTPESLAIMLMSYKFYELLKGVEWCIIDEIHALAENKRGVHLNLLMEHLNYISPNLCRIGLSATVEPIEEIAKYLVGPERDCKIANVHFSKKFDLKVISPLPDLIDITFEDYHKALYNMLDNLIQEHKTTLIFTNTRAGTERVVHHLKTLFPSRYIENIGAHHGSLSKKHRLDIENKLKEGKLKCVVCSTSLELGIDIGYIDLVLCLGSPKSVARFLQRVGRSGHALHETVKGRIVVTDRDDLVECSVLLKNAIDKKIDKIHIPVNALDVLAQVIHSMAIINIWNVDELYKLLRKSYCYKDLTEEDFFEIIKYLAGEYVELEERYIYGKIWYDKESREIGKKGKMSRVINMTNVGTIPDETNVKVKIGDKVIGTIDEAFLERLDKGDIFVIGGDTYEYLHSRGMSVQVRSASGRSPTIPSWFSEMLPLSFDLALEIQRFRRLIEEYFESKNSKKDILKFINHHLYVDENAANAIYKYFKEQYLYSLIPNDKKIIVEYYTDEKDKTYVIFHTLFGRRVNDVLSRAVAYVLGKIHKRDLEIGISDNGFYVASTKNLQAVRAFSQLDPSELKSLMEDAIEKTEILKRRFRHCATRALMILKEYKGVRKHVGRQQVSSMILLNAVKRIDNDFSILKEARREVLDDLMDLNNAKKILEDIKWGKIKIKETNTSIPSPFAFSLITNGHIDIMRMEDRMDFINRMHQMILAKIGKENEIEDIR